VKDATGNASGHHEVYVAGTRLVVRAATDAYHLLPKEELRTGRQARLSNCASFKEGNVLVTSNAKVILQWGGRTDARHPSIDSADIKELLRPIIFRLRAATAAERRSATPRGVATSKPVSKMVLPR